MAGVALVRCKAVELLGVGGVGSVAELASALSDHGKPGGHELLKVK